MVGPPSTATIKMRLSPPRMVLLLLSACLAGLHGTSAQVNGGFAERRRVETSTFSSVVLFTEPFTSSTFGEDEAESIPSLFNPVADSAAKPNWTFHVRPHPIRPYNSLLVTFSAGLPAPYTALLLNYTDLDAATLPGAAVLANPTASVPLSQSPFQLGSLSPGHRYRLTILGLSPDGPVRLHSERVATHPKAPVFRPDAVSSSEYSITLKGTKSPADALQDQFVIQYSELDPPVHAFDPVTVPDIPDQAAVELFLNGLRPGVSYNISVTAYRNFTPSEPWQAIVTTAPLEPVRARIGAVAERSARVLWRRPPNSGLDSYSLHYRAIASSAPPSLLSADDPQESQFQIDEISGTEANISDGLVPGRRYTLQLYSSKSGQRSQPTKLEFVTKPLAPTNISVVADLINRKFPVRVELSQEAGDADVCLLSYVREAAPDSVTANYSEPVTRIPGQAPFCLFQLPLSPGLAYVFTSWTSSQDTASQTLVRRQPIRPGFDMDILGLAPTATEDSVLVRWSHHGTPNWVPVLDIWRLMVGGNLSGSLEGPGVDGSLRASVDPLRSPSPPPLTFSGPLGPGVCYQLRLYTATAQGIVSGRNWRGGVRTEAPKATLALADVGTQLANISLAFRDEGLGDNLGGCALIISTKNSSGVEINRKKLSNLPHPAKQKLHVLFRDLDAWSTYEVTGVISCTADDSCEPKERPLNVVSIRTLAGRPTAPRNVQLESLSPSSARIYWAPPSHPNGRISFYEIRVQPAESDPPQSPWLLKATDLSANVANLTGGLRYRISVAARTPAGLGDAATARPSLSEQIHSEEWIAMPIAPPPRPTGRPTILDGTIRQTDFSVRFNSAVLDARNGLIKKYAVLVAEVSDTRPDPPKPILSNLSWHDVYRSSSWQPYVALEKPLAPTLVFDSNFVTEVIGVDTGCGSWVPGSIGRGICNGPLRPGRSYRVALRAYTADALFSDSEYSPPIRTEAGGLGSGGKGIIGTLVGLLCLVAIATAALLLVRKHPPPYSIPGWVRKISWRRNNSSDSNHHRATTRPDCLNIPAGPTAHYGQPITAHKEGRERGSRFLLPPIPTLIQGPHLEKSRAVKVANFPEHVRLMSADSDFRFSEEFEDLKGVGRGLSAAAADIPVNRNKNRFTNILPFDHSRVKLVQEDDLDGSDYINANYIPGANSKREFIAAQGPLPSTRDDFWRMVWEQQCPAVVNLTRCVEKGREKCDQYWPLGAQPTAYGDLELSLLNETRTADWTLREFRLTSLAEPTAPQRTLRHFHYHAWPDFGVPERPQSLIHFLRSFRAKVPRDRACKPTVVHCSAGVGRSGTLITVDRLMAEVAAGATEVDIFAIVYEMRKERYQMVQTEQQYICIHHCLLAVLDVAPSVDDATIGSRSSNASTAAYPLPVATPRIAQVHQNPAFEDDEGIAESGF